MHLIFTLQSANDQQIHKIIKSRYLFKYLLFRHCILLYRTHDKYVNLFRPLGFTTACSVMPNVLSSCQLDLENNGLLALRELQRKQADELDDQDNPASKEIRRRIVEMVHEMARDKVIWVKPQIRKEMILIFFSIFCSKVYTIN